MSGSRGTRGDGRCAAACSGQCTCMRDGGGVGVVGHSHAEVAWWEIRDLTGRRCDLLLVLLVLLLLLLLHLARCKWS
jgi:hypothetical protein